MGRDELESVLDQLWSLVNQVPQGRVMSYGRIGELLDPPLSGYKVGRLMAMAPEGVAWWRIIGKTGQLVILKRSPMLYQNQKLRLEQEGIVLVEGRVAQEYFIL